jgi:O-antigen/teichoic acid export membrane protein
LLTYGLGTAADSAAAFLVTPILLRAQHHLSPSDYGVLELLNRSAAIVYGLVGTAICQAYFRFYLDKDDERSRGAVVTMTFGSILVVLTLVALLLSTFSSLISGILWGRSDYAYAVTLMSFTIVATLIFRMGIIHLQATLRSRSYVAASMANGLGMIFASWIAVSRLHLGLTGALVAPLVVVSIIGTLLFLTTWFRHVHVLSRPLAKDMLRFAAPFVPSAALAWALHNVDRYLINMYWGPSVVGIYSLGWKLGFAVTLVSEPVMRLWTPFALSMVRTSGGQMRLGKYIAYVFSMVCMVGLAVSMFSPELVRMVSARGFWGASKIVPVVAAAYAIWAVCSMSDIGIIVSKRTIFKPLIFLAACIVSVVGNLLTIPRYGSVAAAWNSLAAMIVFYAMQAYVTQRIYPIGLKPSAMLITFLLGIGAYLFGHDFSMAGRVMVLTLYTGLVCAFIVVCKERWGSPPVAEISSVEMADVTTASVDID